MNNSEILYLYDAKLCNPNGDPDEENRPRMDYEREINLVSDVRIKRYIRDYLLNRDYSLFVRKMEDKSVTPEKIILELKDSSVDTILDELIDVRMFGATIPIKKDNKMFIGPIQFNWGYSLNKVELIESSITSHFLTDAGNKQGAIGKDYRVKYSLIAFSGVISGKRAEKTHLKDEDVNIFDKAMRFAIPELATRSKIGQYPRLYLRVEYKNDETILGDMRDFISIKEEKDSIRDITEIKLEVSELVDHLNENVDKIEKINIFVDKRLKVLYKQEDSNIMDLLQGFKLSIVE
ncbi:type I-B CRISPR-associated protein Cas7/Csh2 [Clostridium sp. DL1XJH146]